MYMNKVKDKKKQAMFMVSWIIGLISMFSVVAHCWESRSAAQPYLLLSKVALVISISLSLPYVWELELQRFRLIGNITLIFICIILLVTPYVLKYFK